MLITDLKKRLQIYKKTKDWKSLAVIIILKVVHYASGKITR